MKNWHRPLNPPGLMCWRSVADGNNTNHAKSRVEELHRIKSALQAQADALGAFMFEVQELDTLSEFDENSG